MVWCPQYVWNLGYLIRALMDQTKFKVVRRTKLICLLLLALYRYQENGIQNPAVARELLLLLRLQDGHWHQVVYTAGAGDLLRRLLRGEVCHALH